MAQKLSRSFYERSDVVTIACELIGKRLCSNQDGIFTSSLITEVEAYSGTNDKACHANNGLRTKRTEVMYGQGGHAYVYLCYGIHHLFNVVTNVENVADAVLIRAVEPEHGVQHMLERRNMKKLHKRLTSGPGTLSQAMGITTKMTTTDLLGDKLWIEDDTELSTPEIVVSKRIGVDYAGEDALKPWRFYAKGSIWVSKL